MAGTPIYNMLDAERKVLGFSVVELCTAASLLLFGFGIGFPLLGIVTCTMSVSVVRSVKHWLTKFCLRRRFFFCLSGTSYNRRYFL